MSRRVCVCVHACVHVRVHGEGDTHTEDTVKGLSAELHRDLLSARRGGFVK